MSAVDRSKIITLRRGLLKWYDREARDLPWRQTKDPWAIWVSEIMLQQTTVQVVIPYWQRFLKKFPNPKALAKSSEQSAMKSWEGLGYYSRVRNLRKAAAQVVEEGFPSSAEGWQTLSGIGPYTANALASIVNGEAVPVVDGNVYRVMSRLFSDKTYIDDSSSRKYFEDLANPLVSPSRPGDFNQAMMELGASICHPRQPECGRCPWKRTCTGQSQWNVYPLRRRRQKSLAIDVAVALIRRRDGKYLMDLRSKKVVMGGLWEFPGGKIEKGETPQEGLIREIKEELGVKIKITEALPLARHAYTKFRVVLHPFLCERVSGRAHPRDEALEKVAWVSPEEWKKLPMPAGTRKILKNLPKEYKI